jgi:hypothetical protein
MTMRQQDRTGQARRRAKGVDRLSPRFLPFRMANASAKLRTGSRAVSLANCSKTAMGCSE